MLPKTVNKWLFSFWIVLMSIPAFGQGGYVANLDILLENLDNALANGNPRALRELGSLIDNNSIRSKVVDILEKHTLFPEDQLQFNASLNRKDFFGFLNTYEEEINYSPIFRKFHTRPLSEFGVEMKITRRRALTDKEKSIRFKKLVQILLTETESQPEIFIAHQLQEIAELKTYESYDFLMGCLEGKNLSENILKMEFIEEHLCNALRIYDDPSVFEIILQTLEKGKLMPDKAQDILSGFTNIRTNENGTKKLARQYRHLIDSLGTLSAMRIHGFEKQSTARLDFFMEEVDYYGFMLANYFMVPWLRENALRNMMATGNSKALYHLAGVMYAQYDNDYFDAGLLEEQFGNYLHLDISLKNKHGQFVSPKEEGKDQTYYLNLLKYWAAHYRDYEYDESNRIFINLKLEEENEETASKLFRKLSSENDAIALQSFKELIQFPNQIIQRLNEKYQPILRRVHPKLPDFRYRYLENLAGLQEYCDMEGIDISISETIRLQLEELKSPLHIKKRYEIEDRIIAELQIGEITGVEMEGLIHSRNVDFNFSISRILDIFYSKHFDGIIGDDTQVRLFLKKSILFSRIGIGGICNRYAFKPDQMKNKLQYRLKQLNEKEYDEDIRNAISYVLSQNDEENTFTIPVADFIKDPTSYDERSLQLIDAPKNAELKSIFRKLSGTDKRNELNVILGFLSFHASESYNPYLIDLLDNKTIIAEKNNIKRTVADDAVRMLEGIHEFSFRNFDSEAPRNSGVLWKDFWKKNRKDKQWGQPILALKLEKLKEKEKIKHEELNAIFLSDYMDEDVLKAALDLLPKLKSHNDVRKLEFAQPLSEEHIPYFGKLAFKPKYLDDVISYFDKKTLSRWLDISFDFLDGEKETDKGKIYNRLCDIDGMLGIISDSDMEQQEQITFFMTSYLDNADFISEFEEKRLLKRIFRIKYSDLPIDEQLDIANKYSSDPQQVHNIQQGLLNEISFSELGDAMESAHHLVSTDKESGLRFLEKNFGLPEYIFSTPELQASMIKDLNQLDPSAFYVKYLTQSGLELLSEDQGLDYDKIAEILEFDVVSPFSSSIAKNRSHFAKGVIRLLETEYPETRFPENIGTNLRKQARYWIGFLHEQGKISSSSPLSFNHES